MIRQAKTRGERAEVFTSKARRASRMLKDVDQARTFMGAEDVAEAREGRSHKGFRKESSSATRPDQQQ